MKTMMLDNVNDFKPTKVLVLFYIWYDEFGVCGIFNFGVFFIDETLFQFYTQLRREGRTA